MHHLPGLPLAALSGTADPTMSERYVHIDTRQVIKLMAEEGWNVADAKSSTTRKRDPLFARHMIDFRHPDGKEIMGMAPRVLFINSHNGTSSAHAVAGFFRFVCSNGLVVGHSHAQRRARHISRDAREFVHEMNELLKVTNDQRKTLDQWHKKDLTQAQRLEYAKLVSQLRWGDANAYEPEVLLAPKRADDDKGTLLTVFNRVQEHTTRGGLSGISRNGRRMLSQPMSDIGRDTKFNAQLWQLTTEFCEAH